jgi:ribosomal-protein-alanine N-acetyltransferase
MLADAAVQLARERHAAQIAVMSRDYIEHGLGWGWTAERVRATIRDPETNVGIVLRRQAVLAFGIMAYAERDAHLLLLAVRPQCRRKGLASALMRWLETVAVVAGLQRVVVECRRGNDAARCLYLEHGYHECRIEAGMYRQREDGIHLEKWLRPRGAEVED